MKSWKHVSHIVQGSEQVNSSAYIEHSLSSVLSTVYIFSSVNDFICQELKLRGLIEHFGSILIFLWFIRRTFNLFVRLVHVCFFCISLSFMVKYFSK